MTTHDIRSAKIRIKLNITTLDSLISFLYKESVLRTRKTMNNIRKFINTLDYSLYEGEVELLARIWIVQKTLEARLVEGFANDNMVMKYCLDDVECDGLKESILTRIVNDDKKITHEESKYLINQIDDQLNFGYTLALKEVIQDYMNMLDANDIKSYKAISKDLYQLASSIININRSSRSLDSDQTFSLHPDAFATIVGDAVQRLKDRNRIFVTGIKRWNTILSPGYMSKRLYTYLAFPGGGKSQILLKSALDIRKYNAGIQTKDPDKRPAVLFITMENSIDETIERIFNMTTSNDDIRNFSQKQIVRKLKEEGGLTLSDKNNIDIIIKYYDNRAIDTNDLYGIIQDLEDEGVETIALILDYLKRIRPSEKANSEKEELKNITNELKCLATYFDIPVITAQQLNRVAATVVDAAIQAKKEDVTRLIGRDGVAGAWEIIENSDVVIIINQEIKTDTGDMYMTFKLLKRRYRSSEESEKLRKLEYFNHPYDRENGIKLLDDFDLDKPLSLTSLATQFIGAEEVSKRGKKNATARENKDSSTGFNAEFAPFDFDKHMN